MAQVNAQPEAPEQVSEDDISELPPQAADSTPAATSRTETPVENDAPPMPETASGPPATDGAPAASPASPGKATTLEDASAVESSSVGTSVADVDVTTLVKQARRGRMTQVAVTLGAAAAIVIGAGFGMHEQSGPEVNSAKAGSGEAPAQPRPAEPAATVAPLPAPKVTAEASAAPPAEPEPAPPVSVILRVHPLGAHIFDGTKKIAHTAITLKLAPEEKKTLNLYLDGYWPRQVVIDGSKPEVNVSMREKVEEPRTGSAAAPQKAHESATSEQEKPQKAQTPAVPAPDEALLPAL